MSKNMKKYIAEGAGTMFLVLMGCGSAVLAGGFVGNLGVAFAFGLTVLVMVYAIGPLTGCHINPAITIAMWFNKKIKSEEAVGYIISQIAGAFIGAFILFTIASGMPGYDIQTAGIGQNGYGFASPGGYSLFAGMVTEFILTALFLFVICGATGKKAPAGFAGIAIGLCLTLIHIVGIPVTGVSVNPARSIGPALIAYCSGDFVPISQLWMFLIFPVLGAIAGAWAWSMVEERTAVSRVRKKK